MSENVPNKVVLPLLYFPPIEYFALIQSFEEVVIECHENFPKQTLRNRCYIQGSHQIERLSIFLKAVKSKQSYAEVAVDYTENWEKNHLKAFQTAFGKTPFYEFYKEDIIQMLTAHTENLVTLNKQLLEYCLKALGIRKKIHFTTSYYDAVDALDLRGSFKKHPLPIPFSDYSYFQPFETDFVKGLSILDLLANEGPSAAALISSIKMT